MKKRIVLCADDYGQALAISEAIICLIKKNRLSATSCMVNTPHWFSHADLIKPFQNQIDIGLHFNLTEGCALSETYINTYGSKFFSLSSLLQHTFLRELDVKVIENECAAQIEHFAEGLGFLPHFIDGHQHIHQFPVIRTALLHTYEKYLRKHQAYIRLVNEKPHFFDYFKQRTLKNFGLSQYKKMIIYATGAYPFAQLLKKYSIPHNQSFAGIYSFPNSNQNVPQTNAYAHWFQYFLAKIKNGGLLMCHPGMLANNTQDEIAFARYQEYDFFASTQFLKICEDHQVLLSKFQQL